MTLLEGIALGWLIVSLMQKDLILVRVHGLISCALFICLYLDDTFMLTVQAVVVLAHLVGLHRTRTSLKQVEQAVRSQLDKLIF